MKNTHLEHPEDSVLLGKESVRNVIKFLRERNCYTSTKWDGAPAIVFGTNPENGRFFVGTKSVFNKKKIKINYSHYDISLNHTGNVETILHVCFDNLPHIQGIVQGDFIGFGGNDFYKPNTIEYIWDQIIDSAMIMACHTQYTGSSMKELSAQFGVPEYLKSIYLNTYFVNTDATITNRSRRIDYLLSLAGLVSNFVKYPTNNEVERLQIAINKCIREGRKVDAIEGNLLWIFNLITEAKELLMEGMNSDERVQCYIGDDIADHEGFVMSNQFGTFKLVKRPEFSYKNFTLPKTW
jgi:hypothetical protein